MATPRKGKAEETPGYCKAEDLANLFALTGQWINQLTRDGILKKRDTPAGKRYNVVESTRSYVQYLREKAAGRGEKGIPESKELEKFEAEVRIKQAKPWRLRCAGTRDGVEIVTGGPDHQESDKYVKYIADRPCSHGLFGNAPEVSLTETMDDVSNHSGPVWTFIFSLKREDAVRLGYDDATSWRRLIKAHQAELADAMKIPPSQFRWCAAFHDEKHHPHIHMMVWSADPKEGYLTEKGIEKMRSKLNNDIFQDEMLSLYQQKDIAYQEVVAAAHGALN